MSVNNNSILWNYLSKGQQGLVETGEFLLEDGKNHNKPLADFSYIVFPFAKAYEGFLKQLFLDMGFIQKHQYESNHFRIGKALNPNFAQEVPQQSIYLMITNKTGNDELSQTLWNAWKQGRNLLFHYFPHNVRAITIIEAEQVSQMVIQAMESALVILKPKKVLN